MNNIDKLIILTRGILEEIQELRKEINKDILNRNYGLKNSLFEQYKREELEKWLKEREGQ